MESSCEGSLNKNGEDQIVVLPPQSTLFSKTWKLPLDKVFLSKKSWPDLFFHISVYSVPCLSDSGENHFDVVMGLLSELNELIYLKILGQKGNYLSSWILTKGKSAMNIPFYVFQTYKALMTMENSHEPIRWTYYHFFCFWRIGRYNSALFIKCSQPRHL